MLNKNCLKTEAIFQNLILTTVIHISYILQLHSLEFQILMIKLTFRFKIACTYFINYYSIKTDYMSRNYIFSRNI